MKLRVFAVRPLVFPFFVALSIVSTALGETSVPERHDDKTPKVDTTPSTPPAPSAQPSPGVRPSPTPDPKVATVEALKAELAKLSDRTLLDILREAPKSVDLDRKKLEDAIVKIPLDPDKAKDELLRSRLLDTFKKANEANNDKKGESLLSLAIADVLTARAKTPTPTPSVTITATAPVLPSATPRPTAVPTGRPSVTPTISNDLLKALQEQLKKFDDEKKKADELAKNLNDALNGAGAGAGDQGAGQGGGDGGGQGGGEGSGGEGEKGSGDKGSAKKDSTPESPSAKNDNTTKAPADVSPVSASESKDKDKEQKKNELDLSPKKSNNLFGDSTPKKPVVVPTPPPADVATPTSPVVARRSNDLGPSQALDQGIANPSASLPPEDGGPSGTAGASNNGKAGSTGASALGSGGTLGDSAVLGVGNFPQGGGGGGGPYTYIKTGPGDWLQTSGGAGAEFAGFGGGGYEDDAPAAKTAVPAEQILRVGAMTAEPSGASGRGSRGLAGSGTRAAGHGVFSNAPTVEALCADGRMACLRSRGATRTASRRLGR